MAKKLSLTNYDDVYYVLQTFADELFVSMRDESKSDDSKAEFMVDLSSKTADIFLGKSKEYQSNSDWNAPGKIDAHLAEIMPFPNENAKQRLTVFFFVFAEKLMEINAVAATPGIISEQWKQSASMMYQEFALMLLGIPLNTIENTEEGVAADVKESVALSGRQRAMLDRWKDYP